MKFDIVRAWKDEAYRQGLSEKQRNKVPANPAGELADAEIEHVYGGGGGYGAGGGAPATSAAPAVYHASHAYHHVSTVAVSTAAGGSETRVHSYSVLCDINVFSADVHVIGIDRLLNIGSCETRPCFNND